MRLTLVAAALGVAGVLLTACATPNLEHASAAADKPAQTTNHAGDHLICRTVDVTGSRMPTHECHTQDEWARQRTVGNDQMGIEAQRSSPTTGGN